jgi:L-lactate dehydrogenase complex protein LldG
MNKETTSKEQILKKIRKALIERGNADYLTADFESDIFLKETEETPEIIFANKITEQQCNFIFCVDEDDLTTQLKNLFQSKNWASAFAKEEEIIYFLEKAKIQTDLQNNNLVSVSLCECVVANTGAFFVSTKQLTGRNFFVNTDVHIVIAFTSQLINTVADGFNFLKTKYENKLPSMLTLISGPSKTADIEQTLVYGAHGPKELFFFLVEG